MADTCGFDLDEIVSEKIKINNEKYPVEKAFGSKEKYTELKWYKCYMGSIHTCWYGWSQWRNV